MRVYEFAKEKGLFSKDILDLLEKGGYEVASHMSVLPEKAIDYLNGILSPQKAKSTDDLEVVQIKQSVVKKKSVLEKKPLENNVEEIKINIKPVSNIFKNTKIQRSNRFESKPIAEISVFNPLPLFEVAQMMGKTDGDLIFVLLKQGMACNRNHMLDLDIIKSLGESFGIVVNIKKSDDFLDKFLSASAKGVNRWPIVVVMGHVDHGKTTLLDFLRKKNTAAKEKGGITQHLGAYEVDSKHGKIVFLDTPGHEAFSYLRSRGAKVTDIAILVIAVEDGVKPQTVEAIKHAKLSGVPIIVAINKTDKIPKDKLPPMLQTIYRELAEKEVLVEEWGGDVVVIPISALLGTGVDELLEMVVLQSQMMELKADPDAPVKAFILESNLEKGFGPVATVIPLEGTLKKGDYFICGSSTGKVRLLINSSGDKINQAGPAIPVKVVGFDNFVEIGGWLDVVSEKEYRKAKAIKSSPLYSNATSSTSMMSLEQSDIEQINLIIKTDTRGSKEAIEGSIEKLTALTRKDCARLNTVLSIIGDVSENDVELASTTGSMILCLHAKIDKKAANLAREKGITIKTFDVIYHLIEFLEKELKKTKKIEFKWVKVAELLVKKVFESKKFGIIAGCSVQDGTVSLGNKVVCMRFSRNVGEGFIKSLQKEKRSVKEVRVGYECGFVSDGFQDWHESDIVHVFVKEKVLDGDK
ncbi:MAG: translation initiation factor IF-2 [bacterium]